MELGVFAAAALGAVAVCAVGELIRRQGGASGTAADAPPSEPVASAEGGDEGEAVQGSRREPELATRRALREAGLLAVGSDGDGGRAKPHSARHAAAHECGLELQSNAIFWSDATAEGLYQPQGDEAARLRGDVTEQPTLSAETALAVLKALRSDSLGDVRSPAPRQETELVILDQEAVDGSLGGAPEDAGCSREDGEVVAVQMLLPEGHDVTADVER